MFIFLGFGPFIPLYMGFSLWLLHISPKRARLAREFLCGYFRFFALTLSTKRV